MQLAFRERLQCFAAVHFEALQILQLPKAFGQQTREQLVRVSKFKIQVTNEDVNLNCDRLTLWEGLQLLAELHVELLEAPQLPKAFG